MINRSISRNRYQAPQQKHDIVKELIYGVGFGLVLSLAISFIAFIVMQFSGKQVIRHNFKNVSSEKEVFSKSFKVDDEKTLYSLTFNAHSLNGWVYYNVKIISKDKKIKFLPLPFSFSYESGYDHGERWSEGTRKGIHYFRLPKGEYCICFTGEGAKSGPANKHFKTDVLLSLNKGNITGGYTIRWLISCIILLAIGILLVNAANR